MGVGDLVSYALGGGGDEPDIQRHEGQKDAYSDHVEQHMSGTGLLSRPRRADGGQHGGDAGADVVAEHDGNGRVQRQQSLSTQGDGQAHRGRTGLHQQGEQRPGGYPHKRRSTESQE